MADAEHLPSLEEGAAEERPDRLLVRAPLHIFTFLDKSANSHTLIYTIHVHVHIYAYTQVSLLEPFIPLLMEEVVFIADGLMLTKGGQPLPKNFGAYTCMHTCIYVHIRSL